MAARAEIRGTRRRTRTWPPEVTARIRELAAEGVSGPEIRRALLDEFEGELPAVRTIQDIAKQVAQPDGSVIWSLAEHHGTAADAAPIMLVLGELERRRWKGRDLRMTVEEADWVSRIGQVAPWLKAAPWIVYVLARQYVARIAAHEDTRDLDREIAVRILTTDFAEMVEES